MIKQAIGIAAVIALAAPAAAGTTRVKGYVKSNGTYVAPHVRTTPNRTTLDNWSTRPNINPTTGKSGTVDPWKPKPVKPR